MQFYSRELKSHRLLLRFEFRFGTGEQSYVLNGTSHF